MLSQKAIQDFKTLYFEEYKITLSDKEASEKATKFMNQFISIYKPFSLTNDKKS